MSPIVLLLIFVGAVQLLPAGAVPSFDIDLDMPPEKRWTEVATHYKAELKGMAHTVIRGLEETLGHSKAKWLSAKFDPEHEAELDGIVNAVGDPALTREGLKLLNMGYEIQTSTGCSAVLWSMPNGTVLQGRNLDILTGDRGPLPNVTFDTTFYKAGKPLFKSTSWPGLVGVHTGMRLGGWSFQQNTRKGLNDGHENLKAVEKGGEISFLAARKTLETVPHFSDAVAKLNATSFVAPQYFILSGMGPSEGVVLTVDRLGEHLPSSPRAMKVGNSGTSWHLVQTNDDIVHEYESIDLRRPLANYMLSGATQEIISEEHLMQFLHTSPLLWNGTVFSTVMVPQWNYYKTTLFHEAPGPVKKEMFTKADKNFNSADAVRSLRGSLIQEHNRLSS